MALIKITFDDLSDDAKIMWDRDSHDLLPHRNIFFIPDWYAGSDLDLMPYGAFSSGGDVRLLGIFDGDRWYFRRTGESKDNCLLEGTWMESFDDFLRRFRSTR